MTSPARRPLVAGNWKMNNGLPESVALARAVADVRIGPRTDVVVAPVSVWLASVAETLRGTRVALAAQNVHWEAQGAFTGEVPVAMLKEAGCAYCIVGHSERRHVFGETDDMVARKVAALLRGGVTPIACVGELLAERESGRTQEVVGRQLDAIVGAMQAASAEDGETVIAYEPVWAIGTGRTAKASDAQEVHAFIRDRLRAKLTEAADRVRILYGGSVKAENAAELMAQPDIDGVLVGGASLDAAGFARIIHAAG